MKTELMKPDSVVLITAGASGIGRTIAEQFLAAGCAVHVCDIADSALHDFAQANPLATATQADVSLVGDVDSVFDDIESHYGRLDVLVNNVGIAGPTAKIEDVDPVDWNHTIAVNLGANFLCSRKAVPYLKMNGGSIINVSSNAAFTGCPGRAPYVASKWAISGMTKTLAMELGRFGVRVNAICPCSVDGDRIDTVISKDAKRLGKSAEEVRDIYQRQSSLRQFAQADDVANMAIFLASEAGRFVSGQAIGVDGHTESLANRLDD